MSRIIIAGGPRTGKSTLAARLGAELGVAPRSTDSLIGTLDWSAASLEVSTWFDAAGPWVIEGVAAARALRKWLAAHPTGTPCDRIILLDTPHVELSKGQVGMMKGCRTVWAELVVVLEARGLASPGFAIERPSA